ncbi:MAG: hypothetical protein KTR29_02440 [Rhodothermaceae bacterium]|nr:hypothetical protein [Rhodothermaceae bacterium]
MQHIKNAMFSIATPAQSRRKFIKTALGGAAALGIVGCDTTEDPFESFSGPEIDELELVTSNAGFYDIAISSPTLFPNNALLNGAISNITDPVSIAYRLQYLIDLGDSVTIETMLDNLILAQENSVAFIDYRGFLPSLDFANTSSGFAKGSPEFSIAENAALSARVAMAASAFAGTPVEDKANLFLLNQKEGYNFYLSGDSLFFPESGSALNADIGTSKIDILFNEFYVELAFVLSFFIGDSSTISSAQVGQDAWQALIGESGIPTSQHGDSFTGLINIPVPLSRTGSANQYFHSLLSLPTSSIGMVLTDALYNVLYSFLDAARFENLPGIYSGGPDSSGEFLNDNGLIRLTASGSGSSSRESVVTVDALVAALRLFEVDSVERQTLRRWIGLYNAVPNIQDAGGLNGGVDKNGNVSPAIFARQNAAMILFDSMAPDHLENFLSSNGKTSLADMFSQITIDIDGAPIQRVDADLPLPPPEMQLFAS